MTERHRIGTVDEFPTGTIKTVVAQGIVIVVVQVEPGRFCAVEDECAHLMLPISDGAVDGDTIICPHHHSRFDLCTGANLDWVRTRGGIDLPRWVRRLLDRGKEPPPLTTVPVMVEDDVVFVEV